MSKQDLLLSEDFREYQKDLEQRLANAYRTLHHIIAKSAVSEDIESGILMQLQTARAVILEIEKIIGLPASYIKQENIRTDNQAKNADTFLSLLKKVFTGDIKL